MSRLPLGTRRRVAIAAGGAVGTGLRAGVAAVVPVTAGGWPLATFVVNVTGSLLLGYLLMRLAGAARRSTLALPLLGTGLLGSYTTFSTFVVEVGDLARSGRAAVGVAYGLASVVVGLLAATAGIRFGQRRSRHGVLG